jgi:predicted ABC-type transport system involved in lysophospholipase L1 biosynthesis ATPase subunit
MPLAKPLTEVVAEVLSRNVAVPLRIVHKPLPLDNEPAKVVVLAQMFWSSPAEMIAGEPTVIETVSRITGQPADVTDQMS